MREKVLSLILCAGYLVASYRADAGAILVVAGGALLPLAVVWFAEEMGSFFGASGLGLLPVRKPALFLKVAGWVLLLTIPPLGLFLL